MKLTTFEFEELVNFFVDYEEAFREYCHEYEYMTEEQMDTLFNKLEQGAQGHSSDDDTVAELRDQGYAVVCYAPAELDGVDRTLFEDNLLALGWDLITESRHRG